MDNQHRQIFGYRDLTEEEVWLVNELKEDGANMAGKLDAIAENPNVDQRALAIARTHLQTGFMWAVRSITKPDGFA